MTHEAKRSHHAAEQLWFAIQLKPNSFRIAERSLLRQGFRVFCPKTKKTVLKFGKPRVQIASLFSGYLFVQIDETRPRWRAISNTYGISRIIADAQGVPSSLPSEFIEQLLLRCDEEGFILSPQKVVVGDQVRLVKGPLSEFVARVERIDDCKRTWILLEILGGSREVEVKIEDLIKNDTA